MTTWAELPEPDGWYDNDDDTITPYWDTSAGIVMPGKDCVYVEGDEHADGLLELLEADASKTLAAIHAYRKFAEAEERHQQHPDLSRHPQMREGHPLGGKPA